MRKGNIEMQLISCFLFLAVFVPYIITIIKGQTQPAKGSWFIWATLDSVTLAAMIMKHTVNGQIIGAVLGAWIVFILVLFYGKSGWSLLEKTCLITAGVGVILGFWFSNPMLAMFASLGAVFLGGIPTFKSAWKNPAGEDKLAWVLWSASCVFALLAIQQWTLADALQPLVFTVIEFTVLSIIFIRPLFQRKLKVA